MSADKLKPGAIVIYVPYGIIDSEYEGKGLDATITGIAIDKRMGRFRTSQNAKKLYFYYGLKAVPSDAAIGFIVYDYTNASNIASDIISGTVESRVMTIELTMTYDIIIGIRVTVETASATPGASFDLDDCALVVEYSIS